MAQETIYSETSDGQLATGGPPLGGESWSTVRNAVNGVGHSTSVTNSSVYAVLVAGKGASFFDVSRYLLYFDMSGFPSYSSIDSLTFHAYRATGGGDSVIAVRHDAPVVHAGNAEYVFFPSHDPVGGDSMTAYSTVNTESDGAFNDFILNSTAITELTACIEGSGNGGAGTSSFEVALVSNLDYANSEPTDSTTSNARFRTASYTGTASDPHIKVTYSVSAGVTHNATFFGANF